MDVVPDYISYLEDKGSLANDVDPTSVQVRAYVTYEVRDKDGKVILRRTEPSRSLVENYAIFQLAMWGSQTITTADTSNVSININGASPGIININAPAGNNTYGIVVGSGSNTVSPTLVSLAAPITNGTGAGQLQYQAMSFSSGVTVSGNTTSFTLSRSFVNSSGGTVTVSEIGIIAYVSGFAMTNVSTNSSVSSDYFLLAYDVPSSAITVQNGQTLQITYTFSVTT
ncbi:hypothetical protein [Acidilobus sp.]|uniref:hypothetical protein n=1 Tax=Acidilobus sp. TaxID=1872109 RepID=UPI003D00C1D5